MEFKSILKLVGAGLTGGYLALKFRGPRRSYGEFLQLYDTLSMDFLRQLESSFLQTMLPHLRPEDGPELEQLLDRQPTFQEQLRFLQRNLPDFDDLVLRAMGRFCALKEQGLLTSAARRKMTSADPQTFTIVVEQLYYDLEQAFLNALERNVPESDREEFGARFEEKAPLKDRLVCYKQHYPHLGSVIFDALSRFENSMANPDRV